MLLRRFASSGYTKQECPEDILLQLCHVPGILVKQARFGEPEQNMKLCKPSLALEVLSASHWQKN